VLTAPLTLNDMPLACGTCSISFCAFSDLATFNARARLFNSRIWVG